MGDASNTFKMSPRRRIATFFVHMAVRLLINYRVVGAENIPKEGGVIIATNHNSRVDTALLLFNTARKDITGLVANAYRKIPFFQWMIDTMDGIWIDRTKADFTAFHEVIDYLRSGKALGVAPEGTRSTSGQLLQGKPGTALMALRAGVPIVPAGIAGSESIFRKLLRLKRPHVVTRFGSPFTLPPLPRENRNEVLQQYADEMMCRIAVLLPEQYHGFYAGHPRIKELQQELAGQPGMPAIEKG
jgi:1-acyl-sn-glycerol-3-phosphate acyltransferase